MSENKFLGINNIDVIKDYIDKTVMESKNAASVITIQTYRYFKDNDTIELPNNGGFDFDNSVIIYPENWNSLQQVLSEIGDSEQIAVALSEGSIWMSMGTVENTSGNIDSWSTPVKISGQNGVSVKFAYSYDKNATEENRSYTPLGVTSENRVEYVWTKYGEETWVGPSIWAMYAQDANDIKWRYCVTKDLVTPPQPTAGNSIWDKNLITRNLSKEYPYMWMSNQLVPAGQESTDEGWSEPILFGHWGMDGADGNVPDYTQTLYHKGLSNPEISDIAGIIAPEKPEYIEDSLITDYIKDGWVELPTEPEVEEGEEPVLDETIWWQCTIKVDGKTNKVLSEESIGSVKRYNAIDGIAKPGQFTMNLYAWSSNQLQPEMSDTLVGGWRPSNYNYLPDKPFDEDGNILQEFNSPQASLWMITANVAGLDEKGEPIVNGSWSEPVKLTGPQGPIAYDYRMETRYMIGNASKPQYEPTDYEWNKNVPNVNNTYPYVWAKNYLMCYTMTYGELDEETGQYEIIPTENKKVIEDYPYFRLSGLNGIDGEDGNRKNSINYVTENSSNITVTSFSSTNMYISNNSGNTTYYIELDQLAFINGYTGKFANVGTSESTVTINSGNNYTFVGSGIETKEIILNAGESIELVCYNNTENERKELIVIGKILE